MVISATVLNSLKSLTFRLCSALACVRQTLNTGTTLHFTLEIRKKARMERLCKFFFQRNTAISQKQCWLRTLGNVLSLFCSNLHGA